MALLKIKDFDPDYRETFGGYDIKELDVYSDVNNEKIGTINDLLVDEQGRFRYFIVDLGFWGFGKKVLLPVGRAQVDNDGRHVHAIGFTKAQAENLPEFNESLKIDNRYEEQVRGVYRTPPVDTQVRPVEASFPVEEARVARTFDSTTPDYSVHSPNSAYRQPQQSGNYPASGQASVSSQANHPSARQAGYPATDPDAAYYDYQQEPTLYGMNEKHHSVLQRYEERLIARRRQSQVR